MSEVKLGAKLYRITTDYEIEELTYSSKLDEYKFVISSTTGKMYKMPKQAFDRLCLSKMIILAELEEQLRLKIERVHTDMRTLKIKFNPLDTPDIIYVKPISLGKITKPRKEVHQYSLDGMYMTSYPSAYSAGMILSGNPKKVGNIRRAIKTNLTAMGFRWSHDKVKKLNLK